MKRLLLLTAMLIFGSVLFANAQTANVDAEKAFKEGQYMSAKRMYDALSKAAPRDQKETYYQKGLTCATCQTLLDEANRLYNLAYNTSTEATKLENYNKAKAKYQEILKYNSYDPTATARLSQCNEEIFKLTESQRKAELKKADEARLAQEEARKRVEEEEKQKARNADSAAWEEAKRGNTIYSYRQYLDRYPNGNYASLARADIKLLEDKQRREQEYRYSSTTSSAYNTSSTHNTSSKTSSSKSNSIAYVRQKEPVRVLFGAESAVSLSYVDNLFTSLVLSIGGHSNMFNVVTTFDFVNLGITLRPQWNVVKKNYRWEGAGSRQSRGTDYTQFYMYLAPEFIYNTDAWSYEVDFDVAVRMGMGYSWFEIFGGYCIRDQNAFLGIGIYFGRK